MQEQTSPAQPSPTQTCSSMVYGCMLAAGNFVIQNPASAFMAMLALLPLTDAGILIGPFDSENPPGPAVICFAGLGNLVPQGFEYLSGLRYPGLTAIAIFLANGGDVNGRMVAAHGARIQVEGCKPYAVSESPEDLQRCLAAASEAGFMVEGQPLIKEIPVGECLARTGASKFMREEFWKAAGQEAGQKELQPAATEDHPSRFEL